MRQKCLSGHLVLVVKICVNYFLSTFSPTTTSLFFLCSSLFFLLPTLSNGQLHHHHHHQQQQQQPEQETSSSSIWYLDGTTSSYIQFPSWNHFFSSSKLSINSYKNVDSESSIDQASLSFEFRYHLDHSTLSRPLGGLLLYTDDETGIGGRFIEIKLLSDSNLRVRIDDNSIVRTKNIIELRQEINFTDGQWHRLELIRHFQPIDNDNHQHDFMLNVVNYDERLEAITLKVDSEIIHKKIELSTSVPGYVLQGECRHKGKSVFLGGLPDDYRIGQQLAHLALPTVAYELHFRGAIRNLYYSYKLKDDHVNNQRPQTPVNYYGLFTETDLSSKSDLECDPLQDRCKHGGYCYTTKNGVYCDCTITDYEGTYCQNEKQLLETTFHGHLGEYLGYNYLDLPNAWSLVSSRESFELSFRTKSANGLLLLTSDEYEDYLAITIRDAGLSLTMKLGPNVHEKTIKPSRVRFDDNQWHTVLVWRRIREISPSTYFCHFSISVDGIYTQYGSTASTISYLISKVFYVGGIAHNSAVEASNPITVSSNFVGCLRKIILIADNVRLDLLDILQNDNMNNNNNQNKKTFKLISGDFHSFKTNNVYESMSDGLIRFYGNHSHHQQQHQSTFLQCEEVDISDPITFTTSDSYLKLNGWNSPKEGTISLKFRTNEPNGVLFYADGQPDHKDNQNSTARDYFSLELLDGHLYLLLNLGSSPVKVKATNKRVDDGHWHMVTVRRSQRSGQVVLDENTSDFVSPGQSNRLDLNDVIYLGGIPHFTGHRPTYHPPELWSASLGYGYIGCVRDLYLNDRMIDIATHTKRQDSGSIRPSCHSLSSQCSNHPCQNGGQCVEGWNRYHCDCTKTAYTGSVCTKNAATVSFNGEQYMTILLSTEEELQTQAESLSLRFRTIKTNGLLLTTTHSQHEDHFMTISLEAGSVRLDFNYGDTDMERIAIVGQKLNDDKWHSLHLERRGPNLEVEIDQKNKQVVELHGRQFTLNIGAIHLGARLNIHKSNQKKHFTGFVGQMQNFVFNGQAYFEKIRDGQLPNGSIRLTAKLGKKDRVLHNAVTFKSKYTFVGLPQLKAYSRLNVYFQFKTREPNGLILFNGGQQKHDFIAVEMVNGNIHYIFDMGDGPRRLQSNSRTALNDNRWHTVTLGRPSLHQHTMLIDDSLMTTSTSGSERNLHLDLDGLLYFGGVRESMWQTLPKAIKSRLGFEGCIASLDLNGETFNLVGKEVLIPSTLVESGCSAPITRCSSTACANRGICVQLWNSYTCDCDLTTFSGPTCADGNESTAYQFGPNPGLISFTFDENNRPDTRNDLLALGFLTTNKNGVLVRVDSATTADYFQLEVIDGNVMAVYNLGTEDIDIGDLGIKVNDDKYHIVRFTRSGQNSTLQIDNHNVITKSPSGKQLNIFNRHAYIQIGGHKNILRNVIEKPFIGIIAGLVFNGHRLLDMAAEDDARIKVEGDIELMISIGNQQQPSSSSVLSGSSSNTNNNNNNNNDDHLNNQMLAEPKSPYSGDDLIYSNAGSGCFDVNEDEECAHIANEGSGDDLITPVYVSVNRFRPTPSSTFVSGTNRNRGSSGDVWRRPCQNEDDDDCVEGSGDQPQPPPSYPRQYNYSNNYDNNNYYSSTPRYSTWTTWVPPTVPPMMRPPFSSSNHPGSSWNSYQTPPPYYHHNPNDPYGGTGSQPYPMRPKTTAPSWTKPVYSVSGPTRPIINPPIEPQGPPEIYDVPLNIPDIGNQSISGSDDDQDQITSDTEIFTRASSDSTVIIISAIAIMLILVVVIGPIVLFYKVRYSANQAAYKIETFGPKVSSTMPVGGAYPPFNPVVRATSVSGITGHAGMMMQPGPPPHPMNSLGRPSISRPGTRPGTPTHELGPGSGSLKKKNPHEWYV